MRGKAAYTRNSGRTAGITPAYAGKRLWCRGHSAPGQDYPRICGEKRVAVVRPAAAPGLPPHMRGKKRRPRRFRWGSGKDHPRICGEKQRTLAIQDEPQGLPPRMRGKDCGVADMVLPVRITPAYAGKSQRWRQSIPPLQDHPRICGEKAALGALAVDMRGSPPRMRGKAEPKRLWQLSGGITPAYAGKRRQQDRRIRPCRDHPRICGEKMSRKPGLGDKWGSPPHMRGKGYEEEVKVAVTGITPAYAGKSQGR